jgi:hypothetical protein
MSGSISDMLLFPYPRLVSRFQVALTSWRGLVSDLDLAKDEMAGKSSTAW